MAVYVFENMSQAQANAITTGDIIAVSTTSVNANNIGVAISASADTIQNITLTVGAKSLSFNAATLSALSDASGIAFNDSSSLVLGTNTVDAISSNAASGETVYLFGSTAAESFTTGAGGTYVFGGEGSDNITGGAGADHLYGQSAAGGTDGADTIAAGTGNDYVQGNAGADTLDGGSGSDRIFGGNGNDGITGSDGNDSINGNLGDDTIDGGLDNDSIRGGQGTDTITAGAGNDQVFGDLGNDDITGGQGVDFITGGAGNDLFRYAATAESRSGANVETIIDFTDGADTFAIVGSTTGTGALIGDNTGEIVFGATGATFTTVADASVYAQQLLDGNSATTNDVAIVKVGTDVYLFYGAGGTATVDSFIHLQGVTDASATTFTATDFGG